MSEPLIKPFKALLYEPSRIGDIGQCVCPPYDIISDPSPYYSRSPYNTINLEVPFEKNGITKYDMAAQTLEQWLAQGIVKYDQRETIYLYEQEFSVGGKNYVRKGIIPLVRLDRERILTHEETRREAREDRERLIGTMKTYTSLIFSLYEDRQDKIAEALSSCQKEKIYDFVDELAITNRFYRMSKASEIEQVARLLDSEDLYIADGHHRLSVAFKLGLPYVAIFLSPMHQEGIVILPYHRTVKLKRPRSLDELLRAVEPYFVVERQPLSTIAAATERIAGETSPAYILYPHADPSNLYLLTQKVPFFVDPAVPQTLRELKVNIGHAGVLKGLLGVADDEFSFTNEANEAVDETRKGIFDFAFLVPPTTVGEVKGVADHHLYMPPKSTYFYPKILSGLVFYKYA
ncbi:MAG TPA: hypothetical protein DCR97_12090 [Deltaproteobacteria bacterium]|nr:hypothetical protein [Deltaproteobacteria bacterium]